MWIRCPKNDAKLPKPTAKPKCSDLFGSLKCSMMRAIAELKITCPESPIWYHLISKHKGTEMEKASLNSKLNQVVFGFPHLPWFRLGLLNKIHWHPWHPWHPWPRIRNIWGPDRCSCSQKNACQQLHRKTIGDAHNTKTRQGHQDPDLQNSFGAILINAKASWYP